jgi:hypothetical protein
VSPLTGKPLYQDEYEQKQYGDWESKQDHIFVMETHLGIHGIPNTAKYSF